MLLDITVIHINKKNNKKNLIPHINDNLRNIKDIIKSNVFINL